jgi:hypothetical protein
MRTGASVEPDSSNRRIRSLGSATVGRTVESAVVLLAALPEYAFSRLSLSLIVECLHRIEA